MPKKKYNLSKPNSNFGYDDEDRTNNSNTEHPPISDVEDDTTETSLPSVPISNVKLSDSRNRENAASNPNMYKLSSHNALDSIEEEGTKPSIGSMPDVKFYAGSHTGSKHKDIDRHIHSHHHDKDKKVSAGKKVEWNIGDTSSIELNELNGPDNAVPTGREFVKSSTFVILPHTDSNKSHHDCLVCATGEEKLDIRLLDNEELGITGLPELFIEFDALEMNKANRGIYWVEKARWLRYEQDYDASLKRFDSPHLSPMSFSGLRDFKVMFSQAQVVLSCHAENYSGVLKLLLDDVADGDHGFTEEEIQDIRNAIIQKHYHAGEYDEFHKDNSDHPAFAYDTKNKTFEDSDEIQVHSRLKSSRKESSQAMHREASSASGLHRFGSHSSLQNRLLPGTESLSVQVGGLPSLHHMHTLFVRFRKPIYARGLNEVNCPLRFVFIVLGPLSLNEQLLEVGRVFSIMMTNWKFREAVYAAVVPDDIIDATDIFLNHSVVVPLPKFITQDSVAAMVSQLKHYMHYFSQQDIKILYDQLKNKIADQSFTLNKTDPQNLKDIRKISFTSRNISDAHFSHEPDYAELPVPTKRKRSCKKCLLDCGGQLLPPFHQFRLDIVGNKKRYISDFKDAFVDGNPPIVFPGVVFVYFVLLTPALTFGSLFHEIYKPMNIMICLISAGVFQLIYVLFSGQPLEIVGITGPLFVSERVIVSFSNLNDFDVAAMRFWTGVYIAIFGVIFTAFNGVVFIRHMRRSVEEVYNYYAGFVFFLAAIFSMLEAVPRIPLADLKGINSINGTYAYGVARRYGTATATLFLATIMMSFCLIMVSIKRGSTFFSRQIRNLMGSLNVPMGILLVCVLEALFFSVYDLVKLDIPSSSSISVSQWINIPDFQKIKEVTLTQHLFCIAFGLSIAAVITTEVATNSISVTKSERHLKKDSLYSINFFLTLVVFPLMSGFLGWPFVSGAMVRSNAHAVAMSKWSTNNLPGVPQKVVGSAEQRISGIIVSILVMVSVYLGTVLRYVPVASMKGMFLYMGIMGVRDLIYVQRVISLFQRRKHWDHKEFLKDIPTPIIVFFVVIQTFFVLCLIALYVISYFSTYIWVALIFPIFVAIYAFIREVIYPKWPRLNKYLSKIDKKHTVKFYTGKTEIEQKLIITVKNNEKIDTEIITEEQHVSDSEESSVDELELEKGIY